MLEQVKSNTKRRKLQQAKIPTGCHTRFVMFVISHCRQTGVFYIQNLEYRSAHATPANPL